MRLASYQETLLRSQAQHCLLLVAGTEILTDLLCSESRITVDSLSDNQPGGSKQVSQEAAGSWAAAEATTPLASSQRAPEQDASAVPEGKAADSKDSAAGQETTPEGLLASSDKPGFKDGTFSSLFGLPFDPLILMLDKQSV